MELYIRLESPTRRLPRREMARVLRLMLAASVLVLLIQIYLSRSLRSGFRADSPAAVPPTQSASVMPHITLEDGSLCHAAPWSLAHLRAQCRAGPLRYFYAYAVLQSSWNAFQHIQRCVVAHRTYPACVVSCARVRVCNARYVYIACTLYPSSFMLHSHLVAAGYVATERDERVLTGAPQLIVTPNYWKPRAQDWRQWRLSPAQRINRMWGMEAVSKKDRLVQTLERRYGVGLCPLMPASFRWRELARRHDWRRVVSNASHWMIKTTAHRGQGLRLVSSEDVLRAEGDAAPHAPRRDGAPDTALAHMLRQPDAVLQRYVSSPLLVNRRKLSLRLYSLVTCAAPLRVYLYREGFALFASDPCVAACSPTMSVCMSMPMPMPMPMPTSTSK